MSIIQGCPLRGVPLYTCTLNLFFQTTAAVKFSDLQVSMGNVEVMEVSRKCRGI